MVPPIEAPKRPCAYCANFNGVVPPHGDPAVVHHDEHVYVILAPASLGRMPGHTLVIPTRHVETLLDLTDDETADLAIMTKRVAIAIRDTFNPNGIHVQQRNGVAAWQTVPHVHFHVIPVMAYEDWPPDPDNWIEVTSSDERKVQAARIGHALARILALAGLSGGGPPEGPRDARAAISRLVRHSHHRRVADAVTLVDEARAALGPAR